MLYKYYLKMVLKKRRGKDGMPKKHDPKKRGREREREKMACQRSMTQQIKSDMKRSMYLSMH